MAKKLILFGGSFDPFHNGHLAVARYSAELIGADEVVFVPARRSPHKKVFPVADDNARFEMICLAINGCDGFCVSDCELRRAEPSYTLDTVMYFREEYDNDVELYWLIGSDAVNELAGWYKIRELIDNCNLSVMHRAGFAEPDFSGLESSLGAERVVKLARNVIDTPLIDLSSTEIRRKIAAGADLEGLVAGEVAEYIEKNGLYR